MNNNYRLTTEQFDAIQNQIQPKIEDGVIQSIDARRLHQWLGFNSRNFSDWIKDHIERAGLVEHEDYEVFRLRTENPFLSDRALLKTKKLSGMKVGRLFFVIGGFMNNTSHQLLKKLAAEHGMRLKPDYMNCTKSNIIKLCHDIGITIEQFKDWSGIDRLVREYRSLNQFQERNPTLPLFALQGQLLEMIYENRIMKGEFN